MCIRDRDTTSGRVLNAPQLGWRDVDVRAALEKATDLPVHVENAPIACALAQMWLGDGDVETPRDFVYLTVGDGVGTGVVFNGELVRGHDNTAGEFGHVPLSLDGPKCMCGASGCWEAYVSNIATLSRYFGRDLSKIGPKPLVEANGGTFTIADRIARAHSGDTKAVLAVQSTGRYLGLGLATVINALNPDCVFV